MDPSDRVGPVLTDGVVRLRPVTPEDVQVATAWYQDPEVLWGSEGTRDPYSPGRVARMYEVLGARGEVYIVEMACEGGYRPVGDAALNPSGLPIVIGEAAWRGRGLGRRVLALLVARARALGYRTLHVRQIYCDNIASLRLYQGAGFRIVGRGVEDGRPFVRLERVLEERPDAFSGDAPPLL